MKYQAKDYSHEPWADKSWVPALMKCSNLDTQFIQGGPRDCANYYHANKAIELDPQNVNYWVEKGGVCLRVNQTAEAVQALEKAISIDSQNAPAYRMLGYIQVQQEQTEKGIANLKKAKELGDEVAIGLLEKYSK